MAETIAKEFLESEDSQIVAKCENERFARSVYKFLKNENVQIALLFWNMWSFFHAVGHTW